MLERLRGGDGVELVEREPAEWASRGREPDGLYFRVRAYAKTLMDGIVFAVDGQDGDVALTGGAGENFAGGHHALFVGQAHGFAGEDGGVRGFKAGHSYDG